MREKLLNLMKSEQLTASKLAELLDIQPSGISHILAGRNKPSFDFVQKVLRRFPRINPDWLLLDKGEMYRDDIFHEPTEIQPEPADDYSGNTMQPNAMTQSMQSPTEGQPVGGVQQMAATFTKRGANVKRVIILFDDHTFESFETAK